MKNKQNNNDDKVFVNSRTYKPHYRAKRGSKSEARVNDNMAQSALDIQQANLAAKLIKSSLDVFRKNFMGGLIWQDLVGHFKQQIKNKVQLSVTDLKEKDIWKLYPFSRFQSYIRVGCDIADNNLYITLTPDRHPRFNRTFIDAYRISLLAIFPDFNKMEVQEEGCISDIILLSRPCETLSFHLPIPETAKQYMLLLKLEGVSTHSFSSWYENISIKGLKIIATGYITDAISDVKSKKPCH